MTYRIRKKRNGHVVEEQHGTYWIEIEDRFHSYEDAFYWITNTRSTPLTITPYFREWKWWHFGLCWIAGQVVGVLLYYLIF